MHENPRIFLTANASGIFVLIMKGKCRSGSIFLIKVQGEC